MVAGGRRAVWLVADQVQTWCPPASGWLYRLLDTPRAIEYLLYIDAGEQRDKLCVCACVCVSTVKTVTLMQGFSISVTILKLHSVGPLFSESHCFKIIICVKALFWTVKLEMLQFYLLTSVYAWKQDVVDITSPQHKCLKSKFLQLLPCSHHSHALITAA